MAAHLGLTPGLEERTHPAAPWRFDIFRALADRTGGPDKSIGSWLEHGAPMGISCPILAGGHFPSLDPEAGADTEELPTLVSSGVNHASFNAVLDSDEPTGHTLLRAAVDAGYGEVFADREQAALSCGGVVYPAPLGNVSRIREDGSQKHRLVQDMRANSVNNLVALPARQVLPRPLDHGLDLASLASQSATGTAPLRRGHRLRGRAHERPIGVSRMPFQLRGDS